LHEPYQRGGRSRKSTQIRSPDGAQRNPGPLCPHGWNPGLRCAPSGLQDLALLVGQNTQAMGQRAPSKIFRFTEIRKRRMCRATRPKEEGRIAIVTNAGRAAVDMDHTGAKGFARRVTVSESVTPTTGAVRVRPNRVVLAPGVLCAKSGGDVAARPGSQHQRSARRRGQ